MLVEMADQRKDLDKKTKPILDTLRSYEDLPPRSAAQHPSLLHFVRHWGHCPKKRKRLMGVVYGVLWCVWKARNERIFNKKPSQPAKTFDYIKGETYSWWKFRSRNGCPTWES